MPDLDAALVADLGGVDKFEPVSGCRDVDLVEEGFGELAVGSTAVMRMTRTEVYAVAV